MNKLNRFSISFVLVSSMLAACGGGGSSGSAVVTPAGAVSKQTPRLDTDTGVRRELAIASGVLDLDALGMISFNDEADANTRSGLEARAAATLKATESCDGGGSVNTAEGTRSETFTFFGTAATVEYEQLTFNSCKQVLAGDSITLNGFIESGETATGDLSFLSAGTAGTAMVAKLQNSSRGDDFTLELLGRFEDRVNANITSSRARASISLEGRIDGETSPRTTINFGTGTQPFAFDYNEANDTETLSGRLSYETAKCTGTLDISTPQPISYGLTDSDFPVSGQLRLEQNGTSVTYTFSGTTVTYVTSTGLSGTVTTEQLNQIDPGC